MRKIRKTFQILTEKDDKKRYKKIKSLKKSDLSVSQMIPSHKIPSEADENVISTSDQEMSTSN